MEEKEELNKRCRKLLKEEIDRFLESPFSKKKLFDEMDYIQNRIKEIDEKIEGMYDKDE